MCNLYSVTTNQAAIIALFRVVNRYVGKLAPMPSVFPVHAGPYTVQTRLAQRDANARRSGASLARLDRPHRASEMDAALIGRTA